MTAIILLLIGLILFSLLFIYNGLGQLLHFKETVKQISTLGMPFPKLSALGSSLMALIGGVGVVFHAYSLYGAIMIILFLLPTAFMDHRFWKTKDKKERDNQKQHFLKNIFLIGGAAVIALYFLINK